MDFSGRVALITGGGNGIGRAAALGFARRGARVMVVDRDARGCEETVRLLREAGAEAGHAVADVTRAAEVRDYVAATMEAFGAIDCFFNNAGIEGRVAPLVDSDEENFDQVIAVNLKGVFLGLKHVLPVMLRQGRGAVVNTASTAAVQGSPGLSVYVASKHGVLGLTRTAAGEVARGGVRVNAVCPGPTATRMIESLERQGGNDPEQVGRRYRDTIPLGRYTTAEEVAGVVLFLCSDLAGGVTGAHYLVDGGRTATSASVRTVGG
ncbi:glucose 1-dehydrogenase [Roseomonas sp. NAR14]|uniref:Glucose 1-dehydrogenase n=1 Tax=Roseomonas acroporae TaxID=2937791 RepID=A0A9X1Y8H7_9PROT|nr:glucose 1-dehydrogenase [Roseomonas acroporae]MCK8784205.1 glucose 1-dehydrogenase [Roseomonas acroporae]